MKWAFIGHTEKKNFNKDADEDYADVLDLPGDLTVIQALEAYFAARGGVYEVQNDLGIYKHVNRSRIWGAPANKVVFKTWEELEAEDGEASAQHFAGC